MPRNLEAEEIAEVVHGPRAESTKQSIAVAARGLFEQHGYTGTSIRATADAAGVSGAIVMRYFGSKEELFVHVINIGDQRLPDLGPVETLGRRLVEYMLSPEIDRARSHLGSFIRSSERDAVRDGLRNSMKTMFIDQLTERIGGADATFRAELVGAQIGGLFLYWSMAEDRPETQARRRLLIELYGDAIQQIIRPR